MATEKRLIDAIALIGKARRMETTDNNGIPVDTFAVPVMAIEDAPTVDAAEVVHGHWYWKPLSETSWVLTCSVCEIQKGSAEDYKYCPNCGADMRERKDE